MEQGFRILVVDDNEELCANLQDILAANDFAADIAVTGADAITRCQESRYDTALVDIRLTDIPGTEVVDRMSKLSPATNVIYITAYASLDTAVAAVRQERVVSYETKPLDTDRLLTTLHLIAGRRRAEAALMESEMEKKDLEAKLLHAQKLEAIGTLAGGVAHDFNNVLMAIQGNATLMLFDVDRTHPHHELLVNIGKEVKRGARLTSCLLEYARKGRYSLKPIDLNRLVEEVAETFGRTRKEISIHTLLDRDLSPVEADRTQMEHVLLNLFINAADAMPFGGDLTLKTMNVTHRDIYGKAYDPRPGDYVLLAVTDTGTGMDGKTMERIFEPFFTTKERGFGTGLGLASTYGIIKGHGGYIDVESSPGTGATFKLYLPATDKPVAGEAEKSPRLPEKIRKGTETILLVDDEEMVLQVSGRVLRRIGYTVLEARSGGEALAIYHENKERIDLVILDMIMPGMGGGETYDRLREINPDVKVVLASGYSVNGTAREILARGCNAFIQKPFEIDELSDMIRRILDRNCPVS